MPQKARKWITIPPRLLQLDRDVDSPVLYLRTKVKINSPRRARLEAYVLRGALLRIEPRVCHFYGKILPQAGRTSVEDRFFKVNDCGNMTALLDHLAPKISVALILR
jgi:hypothetical protein